MPAPGSAPRRTAALALLTATVLAGCVVPVTHVDDGRPPGDAAPPWPLAEGPCGRLTVTPDPLIIRPGERANVTVRLENCGNATLTVHPEGHCRPPWGLTATVEVNGSRWDLGTEGPGLSPCIDAYHAPTIVAPGAAVEAAGAWNGKLSRPGPHGNATVAPGPYTISATMTPHRDLTVRANATIWVLPKSAPAGDVARDAARPLHDSLGQGSPPGRVLVDDPTMWRALWRNLTKESAPPAVNFSAERAVVAALGGRPHTGCHGVAVTAVHTRPAANITVVEVTEYRPYHGAICLRAFSAPLTAVAIPDHGTEVVFAERSAPGERAHDPRAPGPMARGNTTLFLLVEERFRVNTTSESWLPVDTGGHCAWTRYTADPPGLTFHPPVHDAPPAAVLVRDFLDIPDGVRSEGGDSLKATPFDPGNATVPLTSVADAERVLATVGVQDHRVAVDGAELPVGARRILHFNTTVEHDGATYRVMERLVVQNLGWAPVAMGREVPGCA